MQLAFCSRSRLLRNWKSAEVSAISIRRTSGMTGRSSDSKNRRDPFLACYSFRKAHRHNGMKEAIIPKVRSQTHRNQLNALSTHASAQFMPDNPSRASLELVISNHELRNRPA